MFSTHQDAIINSLAIGVAAAAAGYLSIGTAVGLLAGILAFVVALAIFELSGRRGG